MKNVPIKFRGIMKKGLNTNPKDVFVKGYYFKDIKGVDRIMVVVDGLPGNFPVEPDSVCQLIGYDENGKEIYEGDILIGEERSEYIPTLDPMLIWNKDPALKYWHIPLNQNEEFLKTFEKLEEFANKSDNKKLEKIVGKLGKIFFKNPQKMLKEFVESYCPFTLKEN